MAVPQPKMEMEMAKDLKNALTKTNDKLEAEQNQKSEPKNHDKYQQLKYHHLQLRHQLITRLGYHSL